MGKFSLLHCVLSFMISTVLSIYGITNPSRLKLISSSRVRIDTQNLKSKSKNPRISLGIWFELHLLIPTLPPL